MPSLFLLCPRTLIELLKLHGCKGRRNVIRQAHTKNSACPRRLFIKFVAPFHQTRVP
uniref:Uncharacterized protein n=1 Tax=Triticum urartu TaxID=4572 RepID=A0A8R7PES6_TRIUA